MAKGKIKTVIKLQLPAGKATPAPPVGPALGQHGVNIMAFVKEYNERTQNKEGSVIPVEITVFEDRSFTFITKISPVADLIKRSLSLEKGSAKPGEEKAGQLTQEKLKEIAQLKLSDLNTTDVEAAIRMVTGTARSMGIEVEDHDSA